MEALFSSFLVGANLYYHPPTTPHAPHCTGSTGSAQTRGWSKTTRVYLVFSGPPGTMQYLERTNTTPYPPALQKPEEKTQKYRRRRRNALRRFLVMSATIGRIIAPDFDGAHPQGVQWDSLGHFKAVGGGDLVDTPVLRAFFACAASAFILYVF